MTAIALYAWFFAACGGDEGQQPLADLGVKCSSDEHCDNGVFCDGHETCNDQGLCIRGAPVACDDGVACTADSCSNETQSCVFEPRDADGDGHADIACVDGQGVPLGDDCDDGDSRRFPGNTEVCDAEKRDEDCDPQTYGHKDVDGDGIVSDTCCNGSVCGSDCDDARAEVGPFGTEVCDSFDNDCDGTTDEGVAINLYVDLDGDGFGSTPVTACAGAARTSIHGTDCDDADRARHPGQLEICDGKDNDCDPGIDENTQDVDWFPDTDQDGFGDPQGTVIRSCVPPVGYSLLATDCDDANPAISPVAPELCDGIDNDCNGLPDFRIGVNNFEDDDEDGLIDGECVLGNDCDDEDPASGPGNAELCDGRDNDCNGQIDEGAVHTVWFADNDGDGFGAAQNGVVIACSAPGPEFVALGGDCDDGDVSRFPRNEEVCNGLDDDCDSLIDEDTDFDHDADHCGSCNVRCSDLPDTNGTCVAGGCVCVDGRGDCDGLSTNGCETDTDTALNHCGSCGSFCQFDNATAKCTTGSCGIDSCFPGYDNCNGSASDGCEASLNEVERCGACDINCNVDIRRVSAASCENQRCTYDECLPGYGDCDGDTHTQNGCEIDLSSDPRHCGTCGGDCSQAVGTLDSCSQGKCLCSAGNIDCDQLIGCETPIRLPTSCGNTCGDVVSCLRQNQGGTPGCDAGGNCTVTCAPNRKNCGDDMDALTCETVLGTVDDCSDCGDSCSVPGANGTSICINHDGSNSCATLCDFGFGDCDAEPRDCEIDLRIDEANCGACGVTCAVDETCISGSCSSGQSSGGAGNNQVTSFALGENFTCAIDINQNLWCWGNNTSGQLGDGTFVSRGTPAQVMGLSAVKGVFAGARHACAVTGVVPPYQLFCWGDNGEGQAGAMPPMVPTPTQVSGVSLMGVDGFVALGATHSCVNLATQVLCWGANALGQLGRGNTDPPDEPHVPGPVLLPPLSGISRVDAGEEFTCLGASTGSEKYCWGQNESGQIGDGMNLPGSPTPQPMTPVQNAAGDVWATGAAHGCANGGGLTRCWGDDQYHQLGNDDLEEDSSTGIPSSQLTDATSISAHAGHTCVISGAGFMSCWGANDAGQLGRGNTTTSEHLPAVPLFPLNIKGETLPSASPTARHMCAIATDGFFYCWGDNSNGQTGVDEVMSQILAPTKVPPFSN